MLCLVAEKVGETSTNSLILIHLLACSALCHKTDVKWEKHMFGRWALQLGPSQWFGLMGLIDFPGLVMGGSIVNLSRP